MGPVGMDRSMGFSGFFALRLVLAAGSSVGASASEARTTGSGATTFFTIGDRTSVGLMRNRPARFFFGVGSLGRGSGTPPPTPSPFPGAGFRVWGCGRLVVCGAATAGLGMERTGALGVGRVLEDRARAGEPDGDLLVACPPFWRSGRTGRFPTSPRFSVFPNSPDEPVMAYLPWGPAGWDAAGLGVGGRAAGAGFGAG